MKQVFSILTLILLFSSCGSDSLEDVLEQNRQEIEAFITGNNLNTTVTSSGLHYIIEEEGNGVHPTPADIVTFDFQGILTDGRIFDTSLQGGSPAEIQLNQIIVGLQEGIQLLSVGGRGLFILPSNIAFGSAPPNGLPNDAVVVYEVTLLDINGVEMLREEIEEIQAYATSNGLNLLSTDSGLHYIITEEGDGSMPNGASTVSVNYKGSLLDGTVFDETMEGLPADLPLSNVIDGWRESVLLMSKGGKGIFFLPSRIAYGPASPSAEIPPFSILKFEIELLDF